VTLFFGFFIGETMNESHKIYLSMGVGRRLYCVTLSEQQHYSKIFDLPLDQIKIKLIQLQDLLDKGEISTAKTGNKTKLLIALFFKG
jgi:hypothetical protein